MQWWSRLCTYGSSLNEEERAEHCRIFSQVTIHPGSELDIMNIMERQKLIMCFLLVVQHISIMIKNMKSKRCNICKDGDGHGIKNHGTEPIIFIALVLKNSHYINSSRRHHVVEETLHEN